MSHRTPEPDRREPAPEPSILVVDDDPLLRQVIRLALEEEGLSVETAADGRQALAQASRCRPRLVILDMGLPLLDGARVAAELRTLYGDGLPLLVISADGHVVEKARRVGARAHLAKPFELDELTATVHRMLGER
jgi:two-component system, OmpR family, response regulator